MRAGTDAITAALGRAESAGTGRLLIANHAAAPAGRRIGWLSGIRI